MLDTSLALWYTTVVFTVITTWFKAVTAVQNKDEIFELEPSAKIVDTVTFALTIVVMSFVSTTDPMPEVLALSTVFMTSNLTLVLARLYKQPIALLVVWSLKALSALILLWVFITELKVYETAMMTPIVVNALTVEFITSVTHAETMLAVKPDVKA